MAFAADEGATVTVPAWFAVKELAREYGIPPWAFRTRDPEISRWLMRGLVVDELRGSSKWSRSG